MKKLFLIGTTVLMILASNAQAESTSRGSKTASVESSDQYNFDFGPLSALFGILNAGFSFRLNDNWSMGPTLQYSNVSIGYWNWKLFGAGLMANYQPHGIFRDGLYLSPRLQYESISINYNDSVGTGSGSASLVSLDGIVGYAWFWNSFNIQLGGGLAVGLGSSSVTITASDGTQSSNIPAAVGLAGEFKLGWTF